MNLDRIGNIASELSANLLRSILFPGRVRGWFSRAQADRVRDAQKPKPAEAGTETEAACVRRSRVGGPVMLMAGSPVPDEAIVEMMHLAGGRSARVAILPLAAADQAAAGAEALKLFTRFGMRRVESLGPITKTDASGTELADRLGPCDAVVLCGSNAELGLHLLRETPLGAALERFHAAGHLVAGLSAGAALLSDRLILMRDGRPRLTPGLGIAHGLVVDTESAPQSRLTDVARCMTAEPSLSLVGAGLDSGTALLVRDGEAKVIGDASVTFVDPRGGSTPDAGALGLKVHVLTEGYGINLRTGKLLGSNRDAGMVASK